MKEVNLEVLEKKISFLVKKNVKCTIIDSGLIFVKVFNVDDFKTDEYFDLIHEKEKELLKGLDYCLCVDTKSIETTLEYYPEYSKDYKPIKCDGSVVKLIMPECPYCEKTMAKVGNSLWSCECKEK